MYHRTLVGPLGYLPSSPQVETFFVSMGKGKVLRLNQLRYFAFELLRTTGLLQHVKGPLARKENRQNKTRDIENWFY
jgi:hypothetical protein